MGEKRREGRREGEVAAPLCCHLAPMFKNLEPPLVVRRSNFVQDVPVVWSRFSTCFFKKNCRQTVRKITYIRPQMCTKMRRF